MVLWWWVCGRQAVERGNESEMRSGFSGLEIALQTPLPAGPCGRLRRCLRQPTLRFAPAHFAKGHRAKGLPISPTLGVGLWRGVSSWLQVRFSADTRGESRRRSSTLAADFVGALRAVHMPKEKRGGFGANKFARKPAALFLPAPSVLNRPCFCFELRARADSPRFAAVCPPFRARRPAAALVVRGKSAAIERGGFRVG